MAFPTSPVDGQVYNNYMYDGSVGAWFDLGQSLEDRIISGGEDTEVIYLSADGVTSANVVIGTVPAGKVWYVFQYRVNRSEANVVAADVRLFTRNESDIEQLVIYNSSHYGYGNDHVGQGHLTVPVKLLAGWDLVTTNTHPGNGLYYHYGVWIWERDA